MTIQSMTGFAHYQSTGNWGSLIWELRSVNHRYLDTQCRLPEALRHLEMPVRDLIKQFCRRGKVEAYLSFQPGHMVTEQFNINQRLLSGLVTACSSIEHAAHITANVDMVALLRWPGVLEPVNLDNAAINEPILHSLEDALKELVAHRQREGASIANILGQRVTDMITQVNHIRTIVPNIIAGQKQKLQERIENLPGEVDETRVAQELVLWTQKMDVAEECDRLSVHLEEVNRILSDADANGRRLDFLMQELNREANTLASKSVAADTSHVAVELKVLIEQMREQIQNLE